MRQRSRPINGWLAALVVAGVTAATVPAGEPSGTAKPLRARAIVSGPGGIEGEVRFEQPACPGCPTPLPGAPADDLEGFPLSVFDANGSAVIVHLNPDRGINGVTGASGGPRIACGVIEMVPDDE